MQLKFLLLNGAIQKSLRRNFVSVVNLNVNSFKSLRVTSKDASDSSNDVKLTILDGQKNEIDSSKVNSLKLRVTDDAFNLECSEPSELSAVLEMPMTAPDAKIGVNISGSSSVLVENLQAKSIEVGLNTGDVSLKNLKCELLTATIEHGNITTNNTMLGKKIRLITRSGNAHLGKSLGDYLEVEAEKIKIGSCYSKVSKFTSTQEAELKNVHGESTVKAGGSKFKCMGFSGKFQAELDCDEVDIQFSQLLGDNKISSAKAGAQIKLGFSEDAIENCNFKISSDCPIDSYIDELMVREDKKNLSRVDRNHPKCTNWMAITVKKAKSFEMNSMSWIDFFKR